MSQWKIKYDTWNTEEHALREALCTLGNGYFATRGALEDTSANEVNYPGTYIGIGYNRLTARIKGKDIVNEDLVNWPNWLLFTFKHEGEESWFKLQDMEILHYLQELDMYKGVLLRNIVFKDSSGRETKLESYRVVSMASKHIGALQWKITPLNWSGNITIHLGLDGSVINANVKRYQDLPSRHLRVITKGTSDEKAIYLLAETVQSHIQMAQAASHQIVMEDEFLDCSWETSEMEDYIARETTVHVKEDVSLILDKVVAIYTSKDNAISEPVLEACKNVKRAGNFEEIFKHHQVAMKSLWQECDIRLGETENTQQLLRLHIFHLLQTVNINTLEQDVGVPARGLHGEAYRGHIFWDELFIFPFINLRIRELQKHLLLYRYRRLNEARHMASEHGLRGAMFPWQSGSNGREESQVIHLNPQSGRWLQDNTHLQKHINATIVYNTWQYYQTHDDLPFLQLSGAELIFEISRFWVSKASFSKEKDRYELLNIVGPDEYHTYYLENKDKGINNNAYTNVMASWALQKALEVIELLDKTSLDRINAKLDISEEEPKKWKEVSQNLYVPFINDRVIEQFEGYHELEELDWEHYIEKYGNNLRLDRILESEGDDPNKYKASKQADVLMLFYLFSSEELSQIFRNLNYDFRPEFIPDNIEYYEGRTSHGSTLSRLVHSWVYARSNREKSWRDFEKALVSDFKDVQGGTTPEGIHLGAMAGTIDMVQRCYTGLEIREGVLWLNPNLPPNLNSIEFRINFRGNWFLLKFNHKCITISADHTAQAMQVGIQGKLYPLKPGKAQTFELLD